MAILKVARIGNPVVRARAEAVPERAIRSAEMQRLIADMRDTMHEYDGVGLAAPQVHLGIRLAVIEVAEEDERAEDSVPFTVLINPRVHPLGKAMQTGWEGCLSIPELRGIVPRFSAVRLEALNAQGEKYVVEARGFFARVVQHECDHLEGKVYLDRMSGMESLCFLREFERFHAGETD
jgi:peptide deformylase